MKELEKVYVEYIGYRTPDTLDELEMEILGLKTAIAAASSRIASLEQSRHLYNMGFKRNETIKETANNNEGEQKSGT